MVQDLGIDIWRVSNHRERERINFVTEGEERLVIMFKIFVFIKNRLLQLYYSSQQKLLNDVFHTSLASKLGDKNEKLELRNIYY